MSFPRPRLNAHLVLDDASEKELRSLPVVHDDDDCSGAEPCGPVVRIPFSRVLGLDPHGCQREDLAELWFRILPKSPLACCSGENKAEGGGGQKATTFGHFCGSCPYCWRHDEADRQSRLGRVPATDAHRATQLHPPSSLDQMKKPNPLGLFALRHFTPFEVSRVFGVSLLRFETLLPWTE